MAQLSDDCFAFGGELMRIEEAAALIASQLSLAPQTERATLAQADGRILARDLAAQFPIPTFANSAVDGYAVRFADLLAGEDSVFAISGRIEAGALAQDSVGPRQAVRIFTGAPMPPDADTVFMQEDVRVEGANVILPAGLKRGANVRPAGEDIAHGATALPRGQRLRPQDIALAAALGHTHLDVAKPLRAAVFSTGNELVSPGEELRLPQVYDSNR
ncbi:MAG: molybdopterin molybdotransferase MoeA, partial [Alphaproteobacteria bacterium]|nr:molybdopterin molybdotransferase MoeA [Alphaproteobacteria bacterium]